MNRAFLQNKSDYAEENEIILPDSRILERHYAQTPTVKELAIIQLQYYPAIVAVPDFDYLKSHGIANSKEAVRYALDDLGRDLPREQRVRKYLIRADHLPRTSDGRINRKILQNDFELSCVSKRFENFTADEKEQIQTPAGRLVISLLNRQTNSVKVIHPKMNLEIDLGYDSLARAEFFAALENALHSEFDPRDAAQALNIGEIIELAKNNGADRLNHIENIQPSVWGEILRERSTDVPEIHDVLRNFRPSIYIIFAAYKTFRLFCRIFFDLEVKNADVIKRTPRPFIVCPNHQSYFDPFIVCSNYNFDVFRNTFVVGANMYFETGFMRFLAKLLSIVPVDQETRLMRAMRASAEGLKRGKVLNIYPEGERAFDGELHGFKKGAAVLAKELDVPIIPVALDGLYKIWGRGEKKFRRGKAKVKFGEPFYARDILINKSAQKSDYEQITEHLKSEIRKMIEEMRG